MYKQGIALDREKYLAWVAKEEKHETERVGYVFADGGVSPALHPLIVVSGCYRRQRRGRDNGTHAEFMYEPAAMVRRVHQQGRGG